MTVSPETTTPINQAALRHQLQDMMLNKGLSQNDLAKFIGYSSAVVSQFLAGEYKGDNNKVAVAATKWLNSRADAERLSSVMPVAPKWIETPTAKKIFDALAFAQMASDITVAYGGAGLGKSSTIRQYRARNTNVWAVTATPATASVGVLLEEVAGAMGLRDFPLHPAKLQRAIVDKAQDSDGLIIIDEAQHLTKQSLEQMRSIHDATGVGLALLGNASVYNALFKGGNNGFAQLFSRIGKRLALVKPMPGDVAAIAAFFKVAGEKELQRLEEIARQPGALRMVVKTLRLASMAAEGAAPMRGHIDAAWRELQGDAQQEVAHA